MCGLAWPLHSRALVYEPETTSSAASRAELVFEGVVVETWSEVWNAERNAVVTRHLIEVRATFKGTVTRDAVVVSVPGGEHPDGYLVEVPGAPRFQVSERVLLCATRARDATWMPVNPGQAVLVETSTPDGEPAVRDGQGDWVVELEPDGLATMAPATTAEQALEGESADGCFSEEGVRDEDPPPPEPFTLISFDEALASVEVAVALTVGEGTPAVVTEGVDLP